MATVIPVTCKTFVTMEIENENQEKPKPFTQYYPNGMFGFCCSTDDKKSDKTKSRHTHNRKHRYSRKLVCSNACLIKKKLRFNFGLCGYSRNLRQTPKT